MKPQKSIKEVEKNVGVEFTSQVIKINKKNISSFELMEERRILRLAHARNIKRTILSGTNFDAPIIVNNNGKKKRVIDGQHRIYAIKEILEINSKFSIDILVVTYKNLTRAKEKEIFSRYNKGAKQSGDDFIQMYYHDIPLAKYLKDSAIPISVYSEKGKVKFSNLLVGYFWGIYGRHSYSPQELIDAAMRLNKDDSKKMLQFLEEFKLHLQENNFHARSTAIHGIFVAWLRTHLDKKEFWKRLKERILPSEKFTILINIAGKPSAQMLINLIMERCEEEDVFAKIKDEVLMSAKEREGGFG